MNLEIQDMINQCEDERKREILERLKLLNRDARQFMEMTRGSWKYRYNQLQRTDIWREARQLIIEYFTTRDGLYCDHCGYKIHKYIVLHHDPQFYSKSNLFTPGLYCALIHRGCHKEVHGH